MDKSNPPQSSHPSSTTNTKGLKGLLSRLIHRIRHPKHRTIEKTIWCPNRNRECAAKFEVEGTVTTRIKDVTECPAMGEYEKSCNRACMPKIKSEDI